MESEWICKGCGLHCKVQVDKGKPKYCLYYETGMVKWEPKNGNQ